MGESGTCGPVVRTARADRIRPTQRRQGTVPGDGSSESAHRASAEGGQNL